MLLSRNMSNYIIGITLHPTYVVMCSHSTHLSSLAYALSDPLYYRVCACLELLLCKRLALTLVQDVRVKVVVMPHCLKLGVCLFARFARLSANCRSYLLLFTH